MKVPPAIDSDSDDVVWALQTAAALVERNELQDALTWLRRAARAAAEQDDVRSLELARIAADFADSMAPTRRVELPVDGQEADSTSRLSSVVSSAETFFEDDVVTSAPPISVLQSGSPERGWVSSTPSTIKTAPPVAAMAEPTLVSPEYTQPIEIVAKKSVPLPPLPPSANEVPTREPAAAAHVADAAGAVDTTWTSEQDTISLEEIPSTSVMTEGQADDIEPAVVEPSKASGFVVPPPPPMHRNRSLTSAEGKQETGARPTERPIVPPPPARDRGLNKRAPSKLPPPGVKPPPLRFEEPLVVDDSPGEAAAVRFPTPPPRKMPSEEDKPTVDLDLSQAEAFVDMPDDLRRALERQAQVHLLHETEEISGFALAWVERGELSVMSLVSDMTAVVLGAGQALRNRGTVGEPVPLRLVCLSDSARVATWTEQVVDDSFEALPWVEEELREQADRTHVRIGVTLGPLGEAFDPPGLQEVLARLEPKHYLEGEVVVAAGDVIKGLMILGLGVLERVDAEGSVVSSLEMGTILFPTTLLSMEQVPWTVRAGTGGAVVMMAERSMVEEMIMTFPPLLERLVRG
ncbi:MAG TPA: hypothetical protein PKL73_02040 [Polyangiaceae bacterium]|nr:MAG: hypothetical protein BWY17_01511 [Deltaproteobacteria bacterium ADurb.Bin207]HNS95701.1 hypothetical protein [Polyangiaceae bacterium]HNZ21168.1 hypothetical protein [Polyangiaceae bacterium]HOD23694.1 hypothetical protein [Polyangiaceae bacterium]HOE48086.1 hypothetical protein [Polyangiaceae bacterium]